MGDPATSATRATAMINLNTFRPINFTRLKGVLPFGEVMDRARKHWIPKGSGLRVVMRVLRFALLHTPFAAAQFFEGSFVYPPLFIHLWGFHTPLMCRCPALFAIRILWMMMMGRWRWGVNQQQNARLKVLSRIITTADWKLQFTWPER